MKKLHVSLLGPRSRTGPMPSRAGCLSRPMDGCGCGCADKVNAPRPVLLTFVSWLMYTSRPSPTGLASQPVFSRRPNEHENTKQFFGGETKQFTRVLVLGCLCLHAALPGIRLSFDTIANVSLSGGRGRSGGGGLRRRLPVSRFRAIGCCCCVHILSQLGRSAAPFPIPNIPASQRYVSPCSSQNCP